MRPSSVRVIPPGGMIKSDARPWRVTVGTVAMGGQLMIRWITQETAYWGGAFQHGSDLATKAADRGIELRVVMYGAAGRVKDVETP